MFNTTKNGLSNGLERERMSMGDERSMRVSPGRPVSWFIPDEDSSLKRIAFITDEHFDLVDIPVEGVDLEVRNGVADDHWIARMIAEHVIVRFRVNGGMDTEWIVTNLFHQIDFTVVGPIVIAVNLSLG